MKKGFTLVEMLAVIALIVIIIGFATPAVMQRINAEKTKISGALNETVVAAANLYIRNNNYGDTMEHYIKFKTLVESDLLDASILKDYPNYCVKATYMDYAKQYEFEVVSSCVEG